MSKPVGSKDVEKGNKKGLKPIDRKLGKGANQWSDTPKQHLFMEKWTNPNSPTFGNAHKSALEAGYSPYYANQLASPAVNNKWMQAYKRRLNLTEEHIRAGISQLALKAEDSRSPDDTRLKAYETLAKISGMIDSKSGTTVNIVQPILGGNSISAQEVKQDTSETVEAEVIGD